MTNQEWYDKQINYLSRQVDVNPTNEIKFRFITLCRQYKELFGNSSLEQIHGIYIDDSRKLFNKIMVYKRFSN